MQRLGPGPVSLSVSLNHQSGQVTGLLHVAKGIPGRQADRYDCVQGAEMVARPHEQARFGAATELIDLLEINYRRNHCNLI
jgi:hypothetical protein